MKRLTRNAAFMFDCTASTRSGLKLNIRLLTNRMVLRYYYDSVFYTSCNVKTSHIN